MKNMGNPLPTKTRKGAGGELNKDSDRKEKNEDNIDENKKFIRWQKITIEQFGYTHNIVFIITVAFLGYLVEIARSGDVERSLLLIACFAVGVFITIIGLFLSYNRLVDFRLTTKINDIDTKEKEIPCLRYEAKKRSKLSKFLLNFELVLLGAMIILFSIFIFINYLRQ